MSVPVAAVDVAGEPKPVESRTIEITESRPSTQRDRRFGTVASPLDPIDVAPPPWRRDGERG